MFILLLLITTATTNAATVCKPATSSASWTFQTDENKSPSCSSSNGATNDLGTKPTQCENDPASVRISTTKQKAECLVAKSSACKIPMHDFISLDYDFHIEQCTGIWAAPLWMTPDTWQWGPGSGEIDSEEFCSRDSIHLNFAGGGSQKKLDPKLFNINNAEGHITVRKDVAGIVTIAACTLDEALANKNQCAAPVYSNCNDCLWGPNNTYGCWCNPESNNIYGSGGCAPTGGGDCLWTLVSDIWNGVTGDGGYTGCMTEVPGVVDKGKPYLNSSCAFSVEHILLRGSGMNDSLQFGKNSPAYCNALTTEHDIASFRSTTKSNKNVKVQVDGVLKNQGDVSAMDALVARLFSTTSTTTRTTTSTTTSTTTTANANSDNHNSNTFQSPFVFSLLDSNVNCKSGTISKKPPCFIITDSSTAQTQQQILISGSTVSELGAGLGYYLRQIANMTIGWPRGGGSHIYNPPANNWPLVGSTPIVQRRNTPWSYFMNVCTHSYSLVWYNWSDWSKFLDWMSLSGINIFLAMTGQEEVQYKVFKKLGLSDIQIRSWFNGPALLTWSRGQNEYGSNIAGPLPRSWMKGQWKMQQQILARSRSLGMTGQLPGFQGNVPIGLKEILVDSNMTDNKKGTAWMDSLDPHYSQIADEWMKEMTNDFGTDHWWQLDGYFNGGTAPWLETSTTHKTNKTNTETDADGTTLLSSFTNLPTLPDWYARAVQAYTGLNRTDPEAIWSFQGWAFVGWTTAQQASSLKSFIDATPVGKFNVIDMSENGDGEWKLFNNSMFWDANFIWTTLHDFGGTDGLKGWLGHINKIPFDVPENSGVWGTGFTPEGIDQNPVYYEFACDMNFREHSVDDIPLHISQRSHRRYALTEYNADVDAAWRLLVNSSYSQDLSVQDNTGVPHLGDNEAWAWLPTAESSTAESSTAESSTPESTAIPLSLSTVPPTSSTPSPLLCTVWSAWNRLIDASKVIVIQDQINEPYRYDLVNTGREILAQLAGPTGQNFTQSIGPNVKVLNATRIQQTGDRYSELLDDIDRLVGSDPAFLLGSWLNMAKRFASEYTIEDCALMGNRSLQYPTVTDCSSFYEWNSRVQITTWNPTPMNASVVPSGPIDYASKHWNGLIRDYYSERVKRLTAAFVSSVSSRTETRPDTDRLKAELAYEWTTSRNEYASTPVGDAIEISYSLRDKYAVWFESCQ